MQDLGQINVNDKVFYCNPDIRMSVIKMAIVLLMNKNHGIEISSKIFFDHNGVCIEIDPNLVTVNNIPLININVADTHGDVTIRIIPPFTAEVRDGNAAHIYNVLGTKYDNVVNEKIIEFIDAGYRTFHFDTRRFLDKLFWVSIEKQIRHKMTVYVNNSQVQLGTYQIFENVPRYLSVCLLSPNSNFTRCVEYSKESLEKMIKERHPLTITTMNMDDTDKVHKYVKERNQKLMIQASMLK